MSKLKIGDKVRIYKCCFGDSYGMKKEYTTEPLTVVSINDGGTADMGNIIRVTLGEGNRIVRVYEQDVRKISGEHNNYIVYDAINIPKGL